MTDCIFCKIINKEIPASTVYEDDKVLAFLDLYPVNRGHTLVIPKQHSKNILEDDLGDLTNCMNAIQKVAKAVVTAVNADGFNLGLNTNKAAGQVIFHTHFHVIPRFNDDGLRHWPNSNYKDGEMEKVKQNIIKNLD